MAKAKLPKGTLFTFRVMATQITDSGIYRIVDESPWNYKLGRPGKAGLLRHMAKFEGDRDLSSIVDAVCFDIKAGKIIYSI